MDMLNKSHYNTTMLETLGILRRTFFITAMTHPYDNDGATGVIMDLAMFPYYRNDANLPEKNGRCKLLKMIKIIEVLDLSQIPMQL